MAALYAQADCLLFPSKLETWGLPLTEAQAHGLAILAADLPYAHETIGEYPRAAYFAPQDAAALANRMLALQHGRLAFDVAPPLRIAAPYAPDWRSLVQLLVEGL
jgi:glycosyltransferase involved in cell wall biosynthesis